MTESVLTIPEAIQWHEGMLLGPQHFQQSSLRAEELLHFHLRAASPYHWGVRRMQIDPSQLVQGTFWVRDLEAILPDGLLVQWRERDPLTLDLTVFAKELAAGPMTVFLVVPRHRAGRRADAEESRYASVSGDAVADENTGEDAIEIPRIRPRAGLVAGVTAPEKYVSLPLARVRRVGEVYEAADYAPPALTLPPRSELGTRCALLARRVREKALFLANKLRAAQAAGSEADADLAPLVRSLAAELPRLEALLATGAAHPFDLHLALCGLAGHLAGLAPGSVPPLFRPYDHGELVDTFAPVLDHCHRMLDGVQEAYTALPFHLERGVFQLRLQPDWVGRTLIVGAVPAVGMSEREVDAWFEAAVIGTAGRIPSIRGRRMGGAERRSIDAAQELQLTPGRGMRLFAVKADPEYVEAGDPLQIAHPAGDAERMPLEVVLFTRNAS